MGMYTEFVIDCKLKKETPSEIISLIERMVNFDENLPFTRNPIEYYCGTADYPPSFKDLHLKAHGSIKNYLSDIEGFVLIIEEFVESGFAKSIYEEDDEWNYLFNI